LILYSVIILRVKIISLFFYTLLYGLRSTFCSTTTASSFIDTVLLY